MFNQEEKDYLTAHFLKCAFGEAAIDASKENSETFSYFPASPKEGEYLAEFLGKFPRWGAVKQASSGSTRLVQLALK